MSNVALSGPDRDLQIAALLAQLAERDATILRQATIIADTQNQLRAADAERKVTALVITRLELRLKKMLRKTYGSSSEKLDQLRLAIEDLEADDAQATGSADEPVKPATAEARAPRNRRLSDTLVRRTIIREPASGPCCPGCGGTLRRVGEDSDEMLDLVTQLWQVLETIRPKYSCRKCDCIVQAPPPPKPIAKGRFTFATLAHIIVAKWGYHLPFHRQAVMMAAKGADVERSTLARSAGYAAGLLDPIYNRIRELGRTRRKLHTDDTPIRMLDPGSGKTHRSHLWTYVADDSRSGSAEPILIWFRFTTGRGGDNVAQELGDFEGYLQADAFCGYNQLYKKRRKTRVFEVACMAHWRRKVFDLHKAQRTAISSRFLRYMQIIYRLEKSIRGLPPAERRAIRRRRLSRFFRLMRGWIERQLARLDPRSDMFKALNYGISRWRALTRFIHVGELEPDNLIAERSIRGVTIGRRNWLFAGSEEGGNRAAKILSIIETCKANHVDPEAYIADVMERIADDWPASRWDELMPWNWKPASEQPVAIAA